MSFSTCTRLSRLAAAMLLSLTSLSPLHAQELEADEIAVFDGDSRLDYPGSPALDLASPATIEFWVAAAWIEEPAYDPCVLAALGEAGLIVSVHITADRKAIGVYHGSEFAAVEFDFTDGLMHRVVLSAVAPDVTEVEIDGDTIGLLPLGLGRGEPVTSFHLGSLDGEQAPFVGALARLRVWDAVLDQDTPIDHLRAQSLFSGEGLSLAVYLPADAGFPPPTDDGEAETLSDEELGVYAAPQPQRRTLAPRGSADSTENVR